MGMDRPFWEASKEQELAAQALLHAARANDTAGIRGNLGKTCMAMVNSEALLIAAAAKNYDAFEAILAGSREGGMLPASPTTLPHTQDWFKAKALAAEDARLGGALEAYLKAKQDVIDAALGRQRAPRPE